MNQKPTGYWIGSLVLTMSLGCAVATAETPPSNQPPNIGTTLREIEQQRPAVPPQRKAPLTVDGTARPAMGASATTFRVSSIRISGNGEFSDLELLPLVAGLTGRDVALADLEAGAARITRFYRTHGFPVARAYVPAQNVERGSVEIAVLEGRFGDLDVRNASRLSESMIRGALRAPTPDTVIQTAPLDRDLLLLKDLAGVSVAATLAPGRSVGTADLIVDIAPVPTWTGTLEADNFGNRYTGEQRYGGSAAAANLAGRGDLLTLRGLISEDSGLWYGRAAYQIPISSGGLRAGAALSHTHYSLGERFSSLDADGDADIYTLFLQYPLLRSTRASVDLQAAVNYYDLDDNVDATDSADPRALRSAALSISGSLRDELFGGAINAATLTLGRGDLDLQDAAAASIDRATAQTEGAFNTVIVSLLRLQNVSSALQLFVAMQGQYASQNLDPSQKFVLGGPNAVRAYEQGVVVGDEGVLGTAELRYSLASRGWLARPQIYGFFDGGRVRINADPFLPTGNHIDLYGAGVGANFETAFGLTVRGSVAWPIGSDAGVDSNSNARGWIQIVKSL